ncbi:uncharacterized protein PHACADRAFT_197360 [Phanerochaete carnosa HHB-10118-sp]|uniref:Uncharacterized protein n=1 Tax=Phanerochaete carnosa (strain HHB-10118-sp) TaxID=650164 RepID=K5W1E7_PHACS|nr:uncharacterized protein PHACADRAFT_197360 [Phanerochaete carnosa HHB-10118-sp]EKM52925.1 hypothetical protein PHACADRAFT_197360 [Phanerochaete carnosa HHB-10118-sp]
MSVLLLSRAVYASSPADHPPALETAMASTLFDPEHASTSTKSATARRVHPLDEAEDATAGVSSQHCPPPPVSSQTLPITACRPHLAAPNPSLHLTLSPMRTKLTQPRLS